MFNANLKLSLCRTCLMTISQANAYNIFNTVNLANKLKQCLGQPVENTDVYPESVCQHCYEQILSLYEFQQMCSKSLDKFNELLETKETLVEEIENKYCKITSEAKDPLNGEIKLANCLQKASFDSVYKIENCNKSLENKKLGRPTRIKLENEKLVRKSGIARPSRRVERKAADTSTLKNEITEGLEGIDNEDDRESSGNGTRNNEIFNKLNTEETATLDVSKCSNKIIEDLEVIDNEDERESSHNGTLNGQTFKKLNIKETAIPDSITISESSLSHKITSQPQYHHCNRCSQSFKTIHSLQAHIRQHDGYPPYTCTLKGCGRSFNRWHFYNKHQNDHNLIKEKSFKCDLANCERVYKNKSALNIHKRKYHKFGPELKTHLCEICGKIFKSSAVLNNHHYTHIEGTKLPFACEEKDCDKRFSTKEKLRIHKLRHSGIKNFTCPYCGMRKTTRHELKIHINYHTLEKTWSCQFCPKVCNSAGNLKMHIRNMHEGAKDFACRYCERKFAKADTKKYHEMIHTGEKPHECKDCGRRFVQPAALRTHRKIHLREKEISVKLKKCKFNVSIEVVPNAVEESLK